MKMECGKFIMYGSTDQMKYLIGYYCMMRDIVNEEYIYLL